MPVKVNNYNPEILIWAANRANSDVDSLSVKFPKLPQWLNKTWLPTLKQLESFAKSVYVPFGYLFLEEPPTEDLPITFFRSNIALQTEHSLGLFQTIQLVKERQDWLIEYLEEIDSEQLSFVNSFSIENNSQDIVASIRQVLGLSVDWFTEIDKDNVLSYLISSIENAGIMTSFSGTVGGNTHRPISREEFRGFALVDNYAPFIFVNSNDAKAAQLFTLIHELAHVWLGVSSGTDMHNLLPANNPLEKLCDKVAAEFLVPTSMFEEQWKITNNYNVLRRFFKVSTLVLARRALDLEFISKSDYLEHYQEVIGFWRAKKDDNETGGGHFYYTARRRVGAQFSRYVDSAVKRDKLLYRDAYQLLNLKGTSYNRLMTEFI